MKASDSLRVSKLDSLVAFLLMAFSGNPLLIYTTEWFAVISLGVMLLLCLLIRKPLADVNLSIVILAFIVLSIFQYFALDSVSIPADINQICKVYVAFLFGSFLGNRFREAYFQVIVFLSAISLPFWIIISLKDSFTFGISVDRYYSLILFNYINENYHYFSAFTRNCGMFWEPGAFSGFILLVPLMYIDCLRELYANHKKKCLILFAALLSTGSTTGYIVLVCLVGPLILKSIKSTFAKYLFIVIFALVGFFAYTEFVFLGEKISSEYEAAANLSSGEASWSRMGAMLIGKIFSVIL